MEAQHSMAETNHASALRTVTEGSAQQRAHALLPAPEARQSVPEDEFGRGTPRSMVLGFLEAARARNFDHAANYLDPQNLPEGLDERQRPQRARQLKIVVNRALWIDMDSLSATPIP